MNWTPKSGTRALVTWIGRDEALSALSDLLTGSVTGATLVDDFWRLVMSHIGNGHAERLSVDLTGARLVYWPRVWSARAMSYLGDAVAGPALIQGLSDDHWRVRMTSAQALGRLALAKVEIADPLDQLVELLGDDHTLGSRLLRPPPSPGSKVTSPQVDPRDRVKESPHRT